jgi:hypothetical protein
MRAPYHLPTVHQNDIPHIPLWQRNHHKADVVLLVFLFILISGSQRLESHWYLHTSSRRVCTSDAALCGSIKKDRWRPSPQKSLLPAGQSLGSLSCPWTQGGSARGAARGILTNSPHQPAAPNHGSLGNSETSLSPVSSRGKFRVDLAGPVSFVHPARLETGPTRASLIPPESHWRVRLVGVCRLLGASFPESSDESHRCPGMCAGMAERPVQQRPGQLPVGFHQPGDL